eukprot:g2502.t1
MGITALCNNIVMMAKLLVVSVMYPKNFATIKVPLQSTKMMENRAKMIFASAEKEKLYKKIGEDGQKLITAIVGSASDLPWEYAEKTLKSIFFTRLRVDERHQLTNESEFKMEFYTKQLLEQAYKETLHNTEEYVVMYEETHNKGNISPALPSARIVYRRMKSPVGVSDRLLCLKTQYRYYPEHGFAFQVTCDAEQKYVDQIPKTFTEGTVRLKVRLSGYVLETMNSRIPMVKVVYFASANIGGTVPVGVRNWVVKQETKSVEKIWDDAKWNGEGLALYSTEEAIENLIRPNERPRSYEGSRSFGGSQKFEPLENTQMILKN